MLCLLVIYIFYYRKCRYYHFRQKKTKTQGKHYMGKTIPAYPNGWFAVLRSRDLKVGETKYLDVHGDHIALFRGTNNKVYALDAYCAHMGANLGIEGKVTNESCVKCPFHGWTFDGETGNCVIPFDKNLKPKEAIKYEYKETSDCHYELVEGKKEQVKLRKYPTKETCEFIFIWFHAAEEFKLTPLYQPFDVSDFQKRLDYRGVSLNIVNCHIQDIAENGGDIMHFIYIHSTIIPFLVKGFWDAQWLRGDDPELRQKMKHKNKSFDDYRTSLLDRYITEENKKYIGVIHLDNQISVLGSKPFAFFSLTGFQVGSGLVYLFLKSPFFETMFFQHIDTTEKCMQYVYHEIYCSSWNPYWFSALQLRLEAQQVLNDGVVWDNKKFGYSPYYSKESPADLTLLTWRKWYSQFYDNCKESEKEKERYDW